MASILSIGRAAQSPRDDSPEAASDLQVESQERRASCIAWTDIVISLRPQDLAVSSMIAPPARGQVAQVMRAPHERVQEGQSRYQ